MKAIRLALACLAIGGTAYSQDWPGWRGPKGDGTSSEDKFPLRWSATDGVVWKAAIPGIGHSSPVIVGERIFLTTCMDDGDRKLLCLDRKDGRTLWDRVILKTGKERKHNLNSWASSTPTTDGRHIWVGFLDQPRFTVFCYDLEGNQVWKASPGEFYSMHGFCSSPVLYKDTIIFNGDQDAEAWLVALDKATGSVKWRTDRPNRTRSYVPPVIFDAAGKKQLVLAGSKCVASYDPETGKQIWIIDGPTEQFVASMVYAEGMFFITGGFPQYHVLGIRPDGQGNVTETHIAWRDKGQEICSYVPSPVAWGSHFFIVSDIGFASCFEAKTGNRLWKEKLGEHPKISRQGAHHSASPVAAGGYLYFVDDYGTTRVIKAGGTFEVVAKNDLGEECYASPALSRGQIFIRGAKHLYCIGGAGK